VNFRAEWSSLANAASAQAPADDGLALLAASFHWGRCARLAVLGRARSGRSSLLAALGGHDPQSWAGIGWQRLGAGLVAAELPGFGEAGVDPRVRRARIEAWMRVVRPEGVVFVIPASEVDAGVDDDLDALARALAAAGDPTVWAVVSRVDDLSPPDVPAPFVHRDKLLAIVRSGEVLAAHGLRKDLTFAGIFPVEARARWGVEALSEALWQHLHEPAPAEARADLAALWKRVGLRAPDARRPWTDSALLSELARVAV